MILIVAVDDRNASRSPRCAGGTPASACDTFHYKKWKVVDECVFT